MNAEYALEQSVFRRRVVPGVLTLSIAEGLTALLGWLRGTGQALLSINLRAVAPVAVGDTVRVRIEVKEKRETRNPQQGVVTFRHTILNQRGETVAEYDVARLMSRR